MIQLDKELQRKLLEALRADQINLIDFPELRQQSQEVPTDLSRLTEAEITTLNELCLQVKYEPVYVLLTKPIKIRLIEAVRATVLNPAEFPELSAAFTRPKIDYSTLTDEQLMFIIEMANKRIGPYER